MNRLQAKRDRYERAEYRLRKDGLWIDPPEGMLDDAEQSWYSWVDANAVGRAQSLIDTWLESQKERTPEERADLARRAYHDLYRD